MDGVIDLGIGQPGPDLLPSRLLRRAAAAALATGDAEALEYAPEAGTRSAREALAGFLTRHYGRAVPAAELLLTHGASHGLDLVVGHLTRPGDTVLVEAPTYYFGLDLLRGHRIRLRAVPVDSGGLDLAALRTLLRRERPALVYTIPAFQNPTGVTLAASRRRELVELAGEYGFRVVADEVYQLVAPADRLPPALRGFDRERVISLGSFSKILVPGVRLGWVEAAPPVLARLCADGALRSGGGAAPMTAAVLAAAIRHGWQDEFLTRLREQYDRRRRLAAGLLARDLPEQVRVDYPAGGCYLWLVLPSGTDAGALRRTALAAGVDYRPGELFSLDGGFRHCLRLCFTYHDDDRLAAGLGRLAALLRARLA